jgi:outer membrane protein TolC
MLLRPRALAAFAVCVAAAASSASEYETELERNARAAAPASARQDPFDGAAELSRAELVAAALARNPKLRAAHAGWRAALARYPQSTALDDPMLGYTAAPASFGANDLQAGQRVELSQRFPFPGKRGLRGDRALAQAGAAGEEFAAAGSALASEASALFDDYWYATRALERNAEQTRLVAALQRAAEARIAAGLASAAQPLAAEVELARLEHDAVMLETERRVAVAAMNRLLARDPALELPPPPREHDAPREPTPDEAARVERALALRPDARAAARRVRAAEVEVALARRESWPDFRVTGAWDGFWEEDELQPMLGVSIDVPLALGRRSAARDEAQAELLRARLEASALEAEVRFEAQSAALRVAEQRHLVRLLEERRVPAARQRLAAAHAGLESGTAGFAEVIEAARDALDADLAHAEALANLGRRLADLERATGHGGVLAQGEVR